MHSPAATAGGAGPVAALSPGQLAPPRATALRAARPRGVSAAPVSTATEPLVDEDEEANKTRATLGNF